METGNMNDVGKIKEKARNKKREVEIKWVGT